MDIARFTQYLAEHKGRTMHHAAKARIATMAVMLGGVAALGSPPPDYDFDWALIGDVGNPAYDGFDPTGRMTGRGSVGYSYRISKLEVTTAQWVEFVNTFSTQSDDNWLFGRPADWGAGQDPTYQGPGVRWVVRDDLELAERIPVAGITWRQAAQFCNWLHNDKQPTADALASGAYDTSTWGEGPGGRFTDDPTHLPGANFWIPTLDEWMKAVHYDPDGNAPGSPRWWVHPNGTDVPLVSGRPENGGQTSAGHEHLGFGAYLDFPLATYSDVQSPWGLLDVSGATREWVEEIAIPSVPRQRLVMGSYVIQDEQFFHYDQVFIYSSATPYSTATDEGLRVVSRIPSPLSLWVMAFALGGIVLPRCRKWSG